MLNRLRKRKLATLNVKNKRIFRLIQLRKQKFKQSSRKNHKKRVLPGENKPTKEKLPESKDIRVFFANMEISDDQTSKKPQKTL